MVSLGALDLILRNVRARMMSIAFVINVAPMYSDDRAADAPGLGIPAHVIADLEFSVMIAPLNARGRTQFAKSRRICRTAIMRSKSARRSLDSALQLPRRISMTNRLAATVDRDLASGHHNQRP
jgi:hypothetical protein